MSKSYAKPRILPTVILLLLAIVPHASAKTFRLHPLGNTLIEAENCTATSENFPYAEPCKQCSGGQNLGYFWKDSWFEIEVHVVTDCDYHVSMRTSSVEGSSLQLLGVDDEGEFREIEQIEIPKTGNWREYTSTDTFKLRLAAGTHRMRFKNLIDGANVDYLTFAVVDDGIVSYRLPKDEGPNKNPLKGFGSAWWRPDDEYASVGFQYIEWGGFEPQDDQFDWDYVEEVLNRDGSRGRHLILQFVVDWDTRTPVDDNYLGPEWLLEKVGEHRGHANPDDPTSRLMRATKYNDPTYIQEAQEAIRALTNYFKDDPRVFVLQAGLLGFWSEWHTFPREDWSPNEETKRTLFNTYLENIASGSFTQIRYPNESSVEPQSRVGYTNGSATLTDHGYEFGDGIERGELWKNGPITGEWPPNVEQQYWQRFFLTDEGERFIQQARYSTLVVPEHKHIRTQLPDWNPDDRFLKMHRRLGYNFQVDRVRRQLRSGEGIKLEFSLSNIGIAPFYPDWEVQLAILDHTGTNVLEVMVLDVDLRDLQPGQTTWLKASSTKPLKRGNRYQLGLRMIQPGADQAKPNAWKLDARNVYIALANEVPVLEGSWNKDDHSLRGGWNLIGDVTPSTNPFPFEGSTRPLKAISAQE